MVRDEELMAELARGGHAAMVALVHRYHRPLFAFHYRLTGDRPAAEDLVQETFLRLLQASGRYRPEEAFRPWLFTIAHNLVRDHWKAAHRRREVPGGAAGELEGLERDAHRGRGVVDLLDHQVERRRVMAALAGLPEEQRTTVVLRFYHDLSLAEVARVTGVPEGTVKSRLAAAERRLRPLLKEAKDDAADSRLSR